jgi:hypothetical protein
MKKKHLIISGSVMLFFGPFLGLLICVEALKLSFDRLAATGTSVPFALLASSINHCILWTAAGAVVGLIGLTLLIVGLVRKNPAKP